jgi:GWxTD domain-containing protein
MVRRTFFLLFCISFSVLSQERPRDREVPDRTPQVSFEAVSVFGSDSTKASVNIHYRIPRSFFVFVRSNDPAAARDEFVARGQLQVELFNEQDVSVAREIRPIALTRKSQPQAEEPQEDIEGAIPFLVDTAQLNIVFEVDDLESGRSFLDKNHSVRARFAAHKSLDISPPFFASIDSTSQNGFRYFPINHGNNIRFGNAHGGIVSQVYCSGEDTAVKVNWILRGEADNKSQQLKDLKGSHFVLATGYLSLATKEGPVRYQAKPSRPAWKVLYVPMPMELLEPGQYKLEINATDGKEQFKHEMPFRVVWPNRPMSLVDWDIATDALRFIAKPEELDKIVSSSSEEGLAAFRAFWKKRDPDTTSAYNEIMVEYYRRVDEAIRQFSTVKDQDGYKTDRGRIYILNGPPTHIERSVLPGQPTREIWTYSNNIKKQFVFTERNKSGNFILTQSNNL